MEQQDRIDQLVAENQELLALTKQAFVKREVEKESVPVDEEWEKFAAEHADELEALEKDEPHTATIKKLMGILPYKVAASIIGILFTVGVAFAAIHIVRMVSNPKPQTIQAEQTISAKPTSVLPTDTVKTDTTTTTMPIVFDNVSLDKMMPQIAAGGGIPERRCPPVPFLFRVETGRDARSRIASAQPLREHHRRTEVGQDSSRISHEDNHINACLLLCLCRSAGPKDYTRL